MRVLQLKFRPESQAKFFKMLLVTGIVFAKTSDLSVVVHLLFDPRDYTHLPYQSIPFLSRLANSNHPNLLPMHCHAGAIHFSTRHFWNLGTVFVLVALT